VNLQGDLLFVKRTIKQGRIMNNEPTLEGIEDFDNNESAESRSIFKKVIVGLLILGAVYAGVKMYFSDVSDRLDTSERPSVYDK